MDKGGLILSFENPKYKLGKNFIYAIGIDIYYDKHFSTLCKKYLHVSRRLRRLETGGD